MERTLRPRKLALVIGTALVAVAPVLSAQQVLAVAPAPGSGVFSTQIQPAVDAAAEGDIVLVKPGLYSGFDVNAKSLTVIADGSVRLSSAIRIMNLTAKQRCLVQGFSAHPAFMQATPALQLNRNDGPVWITGCTLTGGNAFARTPATDGVSATHCASVTLLRCTVTGGTGGDNVPFSLSGSVGLRAFDSILFLFDTVCAGGVGLTGNRPTRGGAGAKFDGGTVFASGTTMQGGRGGSSSSSSSLAAGGAGGVGCICNSVMTVLGCSFVGGAGGSGQPVGPQGAPKDGSGMMAAWSGTARHFECESPVREQQTVTLRAGGLPGEQVGVLYTSQPSAGDLMPSYLGAAAVSIAHVEGLSLGTIGSGGSASFPVSVPLLPPTTHGTTVYLQAVFFDAPLTYAVLGPPSACVVLGASP